MDQAYARLMVMLNKYLLSICLLLRQTVLVLYLKGVLNCYVRHKASIRGNILYVSFAATYVK